MITIQSVEINRFRSIRESLVSDLKDFSVLVGLNNSGKSNFLRALNLFFTGQPEPGKPFDLARDYFRGELSAKKKKVVRVSICFTLPSTFRFRKELKVVEVLLGRDFKITKEWTSQKSEPTIYLNDSAASLSQDDSEKVIQFLALISFRYIPNRVVPTEVIMGEQRALRDVLVRRLAKTKKQSENVFKEIKKTAESLVESISDNVTGFAPSIEQVRFATAGSLADLAFQFGYRLREGGVETDENEQGSGMQSLLMLETLHLIDRDYFQRFGWKQAAVWAVEEPESSLHTELEARTANFLAQAARVQRGRLQIIGTTHSDFMIQHADAGYYIEKICTNGRSYETTAVKREAEDLVVHSSQSGVSRWVNPLLLHPLKSLVLVEGKFDRDFLNQCFRALNLEEAPRVACLEDLSSNSSKGGVDTLIRFIKDNADAIRARKPFAKVCALFDFDAEGKKNSFSGLFNPSDPFISMVWDKGEANPNKFLQHNCRGVECFYPDTAIEYAKNEQPDLFFVNKSGEMTVKKEEGETLKRLLNKYIKMGLRRDEITFAEPLIGRLRSAL
jgi:AAA15 family ATPase/GTPase